MSKLSDKLKYLRVSNNISQRALAQTIGVTPSCLSNWESGIRVPHINYILKYIKIFNISASYFDVDDKPDITLSPRSYGLDVTKLNARGLKQLNDYYNRLLSDAKNLKDDF